MVLVLNREELDQASSEVDEGLLQDLECYTLFYRNALKRAEDYYERGFNSYADVEYEKAQEWKTKMLETQRELMRSGAYDGEHEV